jgi:hypothetical protein
MDYSTDLGGYYIRQLVASGYLSKTTRGQYEVTPIGKQQLILFNKEDTTLISNPRLCTMVLAIVGGKYVVTRRKLQPYIGYAEWPASRVKSGVDLEEAAQDVLRRRLHVVGPLEFKGFFRRIDLQGDMVFDDKLFAVYICALADDAPVIPETDHGINIPMTAEEVEVAERAPCALRDILHFCNAPTSYAVTRYQLTPEEITAGS